MGRTSLTLRGMSFFTILEWVPSGRICLWSLRTMTDLWCFPLWCDPDFQRCCAIQHGRHRAKLLAYDAAPWRAIPGDPIVPYPHGSHYDFLP